jgi:hypothetical protein
LGLLFLRGTHGQDAAGCPCDVCAGWYLKKPTERVPWACGGELRYFARYLQAGCAGCP